MPHLIPEGAPRQKLPVSIAGIQTHSLFLPSTRTFAPREVGGVFTKKSEPFTAAVAPLRSTSPPPQPPRVRAERLICD